MNNRCGAREEPNSIKLLKFTNLFLFFLHRYHYTIATKLKKRKEKKAITDYSRIERHLKEPI